MTSVRMTWEKERVQKMEKINVKQNTTPRFPWLDIFSSLLYFGF